MLDEYYKEANTVYDPSPIVTWDHPALVTNAINSSDSKKLHAKHVSHSTRVHLLLASLKTLPASKLSVNTYHNQLLSLSLYLRDDKTLLLTKDGMILCNDIYNWYESVK
jgi:GR25 family glycosyltransferase involved in LPS biosynthesis